MLKLIRKIEDGIPSSTSLTLPWSQRIRSRLRVCLDNGVEAGLFLERGLILRGGDLLCSEGGEVVRIDAAREHVSTVRSKDQLQLARLCYHLGNRHVDLEIGHGYVRYLHDHVLDGLVENMGLTVLVEESPFEPESGAYGANGHGHQHG